MIGGWMELKTGKTERKPVKGRRRIEPGADIHLPAAKQPQTFLVMLSELELFCTES